MARASPVNGIAHAAARAVPWAQPWPRNIALGVFAGGLLFYLLTLAPTVLWGDDAGLQIRSYTQELDISAGSHPLWIILSQPFIALPVGDGAYRANLATATFAAVALALLFQLLRSLNIELGPALLSVLALMVSHTFWLHAVRAEVYSLHLALMLGQIWLVVTWAQGRRWALPAIALLFGLSLFNHVMTLLLAPGYAWALWSHRRQLSPLDVVLTVLALGLVLVVLVFLARAEYGPVSVGFIIDRVLLSSGEHSYAGNLLDVSPGRLARNLVTFAGVNVLQFIGLGLAAVLVGLVSSWRRWSRWLAVFILLLYSVNAAFAFSYNVRDQIVFYLPSYAIMAVWAGLGFQVLLERWARFHKDVGVKPQVLALVAALVLALPVTTYRLLPELVDGVGLPFLAVRNLPGRQGSMFFLWPPKNGYTGARDYAIAALSAVPPDSAIIADWTVFAPLAYLQQVERQRTDVAVIYWQAGAAGLQPIVEQQLAQRSAVFLADNDLAYYPLGELAHEYELVPAGVVYRVVRR